TKRLIRLVNDNLNYEKIRTNQISMERKVFDAAAVLENLREQLCKKAAANKDELKLVVPDSIPVYADYDRFVQIMFNIIQNAIQFTTGGQITISAQRVAQGTEVKVADT
ncbi:sensor histidine kinase, partial [Limosilactobacillus fermentum]|nr:sensor histidine kinase [Limosilactobacillus fermentum]